MRTLRGSNSKNGKKGDDSISEKKKNSRREKNEPLNEDDDIGTNGDETTDDEGAIDTPPPPIELQNQIDDEDQLADEMNKENTTEDDERNDDTKIIPIVKKKKKKDVPDEYEVEQIVDMLTQQRWKCPVKFRVRWVGFTEKDDSWLPAFQLHCEEAIQEFLEISGRKPEYTKVLEAKKMADELIIENLRKSTRHTNVIGYSELDEDTDEVLPTGTRTRRFKTSDPKKQTTSKISAPIYSVEKIIDHRVINKHTEYKVNWTGFGVRHDSWVSEAILGCPKKIKNYIKAFNAVSTENEEYEVDFILDSRTIKGKTQYKVHWKNYSAKFDSWISAAELNCPNLIKEFKKSVKPDNDEFQVEKILDERTRRGKREYFVHWKGTSASNNSWEPTGNLTHCSELLVNFLEERSNEEDDAAADSASDESVEKVIVTKKENKKKGRKQATKRRSEMSEPEVTPRSRRKVSAISSYSEMGEEE